MTRRTAWLFDLDNTLHDARPYIFPHINRAMTEFIARNLSIAESEAQALRMHYWARYGATLKGLARHHGIDPHRFLAETHRFPDLGRMVVAERGLRHTLERLPGRRILFSNSPLAYAEAVLEVLGIAHLFDAVYSVERTRFRPKPDPAGFRLILSAEGLAPTRTVMVEDVLENLAAARRLGLRTVWVSREPRRPHYVDLRVSSLAHLPWVLPHLGATRSGKGANR